MPPDPSTDPAKPWFKTLRGWWRGARWLTVAVLLLWGGYQLMWDKVADICSDQLADNSSVVKVCEPIGLTDPRIAWILLIVLLLLLPDLSEIELAGALSLKRAVTEVQRENENLRSDVQQLRITTSQIAHQQQQTNIYLYDQRVPAALAQWQADLEHGDTGALTPVEETGAFAYLAFSSALAGLVPSSLEIRTRTRSN